MQYAEKGLTTCNPHVWYHFWDRWSGAGVIDYTSLTWDDLAVKLLGSDEDSKV